MVAPLNLPPPHDRVVLAIVEARCGGFGTHNLHPRLREDAEKCAPDPGKPLRHAMASLGGGPQARETSGLGLRMEITLLAVILRKLTHGLPSIRGDLVMFKLLASSIAVAGLAMGMSASAFATKAPSNGLGQAWPNATDVSASPHWHVYAFVENGIRFIQINDLNGNVRAAFAASNGDFLVLPMGRDAERMATPQQHANRNASFARGAYAETIYRDDAVQVTAVPLSDGTMTFSATSSGGCDNKEDCSGHIVSP